MQPVSLLLPRVAQAERPYAGQLAAGASAGAASGHSATAATPSCCPQPACPRDEETCRVNMVREKYHVYFWAKFC